MNTIHEKAAVFPPVTSVRMVLTGCGQTGKDSSQNRNLKKPFQSTAENRISYWASDAVQIRSIAASSSSVKLQ